MNTEAKITCKTCGITDVPDWNGEGDCITCARDKVLNTEALDTPNNGWIKNTRCPACSKEALFIGSGGYITCSHLDCPNPDYSESLQQHIDRECLKSRIDEVEYMHDMRFMIEDEDCNWFHKRIKSLIQEVTNEPPAST